MRHVWATEEVPGDGLEIEWSGKDTNREEFNDSSSITRPHVPVKKNEGSDMKYRETCLQEI